MSYYVDQITGKIEWEILEQDRKCQTARLRVRDGWLYRETKLGCEEGTVALCFVPEPRMATIGDVMTMIGAVGKANKPFVSIEEH